MKKVTEIKVGYDTDMIRVEGWIHLIKCLKIYSNLRYIVYSYQDGAGSTIPRFIEEGPYKISNRNNLYWTNDGIKDIYYPWKESKIWKLLNE